MLGKGASLSNYDLYLICVKNKGKKLTTKEALKLFEYSINTEIRGSRIHKFLEAIEYKHPKQFWMVRSIVAVPMEVAYSHQISLRFKEIIFKKNEKLFLVPRNLVPFWVLEEYGGKY